MKKKLTIITLFLILTLILGICFNNISNAAIEIKPGTKRHTNIQATTAYQYCYDMRSSTSTLGNNSLDPHLTLNADWTATAYLGASVYGNVRNQKGNGVIIGGSTTYNSTTNNITGVMNMGSPYIFTSSLLTTYNTNECDEYINLVNNKNTKYVEVFEESDTIENAKGKGTIEVKNWWDSNYNYANSSNPLIFREKIFGIANGKGNSDSYRTYRPVIWN